MGVVQGVVDVVVVRLRQVLNRVPVQQLDVVHEHPGVVVVVSLLLLVVSVPLKWFDLVGGVQGVLKTSVPEVERLQNQRR